MVAARRAALVATSNITTDPDVRLHKVESENYTRGMLTAMLGATSLFGGTEIYLIDTPSEGTDFYDEVVSVLPQMSTSSNSFIVIEGPLVAAERKQFEKSASVLEEFKKAAAAPFNAFAMADALSARDKKSHCGCCCKQLSVTDCRLRRLLAHSGGNSSRYGWPPSQVVPTKPG